MRTNPLIITFDRNNETILIYHRNHNDGCIDERTS